MTYLYSLNGFTTAMIDVDQSLFVNWGIFLVTTIAVYTIILKPVLAIQDVRHDRTAGAKAKAAEMEQRAQDNIARYESLIADESKQGKAGIDGAREEAQKVAAGKMADARETAQKQLDAEMPKLQAAYEASLGELADSAEELSNQIVAKITGAEAQA